MSGEVLIPGAATGPLAGVVPRRALHLLIVARAHLAEAERAQRPPERYVAAHLAALRAATAIVVARSCGASGPASTWRLLTVAAPEWRGWSELFAAGSQRRAAAEAGSPGMSADEADALLRRAGEFLDLVGRSLSVAVR